MSDGTEAERAVRCVVTGRVQAVGFRAATLRQAAALRLKGWARNLPDGSVEVVAAGDAPALAALANWLWQGPRGARVTAVTLEEWPSGVPAGFSIR